MKELKHYIIGGIIFVLAAGTLSHFLYEWTGNSFVVGLFTPVNESVWEHMKLVFFPMLLYSSLMVPKLKNRYPCISSAYCFGMLLGTVLVPVLFYAYTFAIGHNVFFLDLATFAASVIIAFVSVYKLTLSRRTWAFSFLLYALAAAGIICFLLFSYNPPPMAIFTPPVTTFSGFPIADIFEICYTDSNICSGTIFLQDRLWERGMEWQ